MAALLILRVECLLSCYPDRWFKEINYVRAEKLKAEKKNWKLVSALVAYVRL